jgi:hypothetical protein
MVGLVADVEGFYLRRKERLAVVNVRGEEGGALTFHIGQVGKCEWAGLCWPGATVAL